MTTSALPILFDPTPLPGLSKWLPKEIIFGDFNFDIPIEPNLNKVKTRKEKKREKRKKFGRRKTAEKCQNLGEKDCFLL